MLSHHYLLFLLSPSGLHVALVDGRCACAAFSSLIFQVLFLHFWLRSGVILASFLPCPKSVLQRSRRFGFLSSPQPRLFCPFLMSFVVVSCGVALPSPLCSSQRSSIMLCNVFLPGHVRNEASTVMSLLRRAHLFIILRFQTGFGLL